MIVTNSCRIREGFSTKIYKILIKLYIKKQGKLKKGKNPAFIRGICKKKAFPIWKGKRFYKNRAIK
ncbi:hypothetical protein DOZ91_11280 [Peribacillus frigoritolerans]|nr:hypothetical protein DOZ91_11280 [Peribacillus frigoritolerans]